MIAIFRHGETYGNVQNRLQGWSDSLLTPKGIAQVRDTADRFFCEYGFRFCNAVLLSSDLGRSLSSVEIFQKMCYINLWTLGLTSLRELHWGEWEGHKAEDHSFDLEMRKLDKWHWKPHGGESYTDLDKRVRKLIIGNGFTNVDPEHLLIYHVHQNVSVILRGIYLDFARDRVLELDHNHEEFFVI